MVGGWVWGVKNSPLWTTEQQYGWMRWKGMIGKRREMGSEVEIPAPQVLILLAFPALEHVEPRAPKVVPDSATLN